MMSKVRRAIGDSVRRFRLKRDLTQEQAAALCEMDVRLYGKVERRVENYEMKTLEKVLNGLSMSREDF